MAALFAPLLSVVIFVDNPLLSMALTNQFNNQNPTHFPFRPSLELDFEIFPIGHVGRSPRSDRFQGK
jgi:hypothetical protein